MWVMWRLGTPGREDPLGVSDGAARLFGPGEGQAVEAVEGPR